MRGISICDLNSSGSYLAFDVEDLLKILGIAGAQSLWKVSNLELLSDREDEIRSTIAGADRILGVTLKQLFHKVQTINGLFEGYDNSEARPWIRIHAVDSTCFDVETDRDDIIQNLKQVFRSTTDLEID